MIIQRFPVKNKGSSLFQVVHTKIYQPEAVRISDLLFDFMRNQIATCTDAVCHKIVDSNKCDAAHFPLKTVCR